MLSKPLDAQGKEITWRNVAALDGFARRLNDVATRLAERNRHLRKWHAVLADKVVGLMHTDLVRNKVSIAYLQMPVAPPPTGADTPFKPRTLFDADAFLPQ